MSIETIKRTLANNIVIITVKKTDPHSIRPFATFTVVPTSRFVHRFSDFVTEAAALQRHGGARARFDQGEGGCREHGNWLCSPRAG